MLVLIRLEWIDFYAGDFYTTPTFDSGLSFYGPRRYRFPSFLSVDLTIHSTLIMINNAIDIQSYPTPSRSSPPRYTNQTTPNIPIPFSSRIKNQTLSQQSKRLINRHTATIGDHKPILDLTILIHKTPFALPLLRGSIERFLPRLVVSLKPAKKRKRSA